MELISQVPINWIFKGLPSNFENALISTEGICVDDFSYPKSFKKMKKSQKRNVKKIR